MEKGIKAYHSYLSFGDAKEVLSETVCEDLNLGEFRKSILKFIPRYMMPTVNNRVESMEINANGKIDRKYYTALLNG